MSEHPEKARVQPQPPTNTPAQALMEAQMSNAQREAVAAETKPGPQGFCTIVNAAGVEHRIRSNQLSYLLKRNPTWRLKGIEQAAPDVVQAQMEAVQDQVPAHFMESLMQSFTQVVDRLNSLEQRLAAPAAVFPDTEPPAEDGVYEHGDPIEAEDETAPEDLPPEVQKTATELLAMDPLEMSLDELRARLQLRKVDPPNAANRRTLRKLLGEVEAGL